MKERIPSEQDRFQKVVERIEALPLDYNNKIDALLVLRGLKPATEIEYKVHWSPGEEAKELSEEDIENLVETLEEAGLVVTTPEKIKQEPGEIYDVVEGEERYYQVPGMDAVRFFVASNKEDAKNK